MPLAEKAKRAAVLVRQLLQFETGHEDILVQLRGLYPRAVFHFERRDRGTGLTVLHPQGMRLPRAVLFSASYRIEVRQDALAVHKDRDGMLNASPEALWSHFQLCTGLEPDGLPGYRTKAKMREIAVIPTKVDVPPVPRTAWERLMAEDETL